MDLSGARRGGPSKVTRHAVTSRTALLRFGDDRLGANGKVATGVRECEIPPEYRGWWRITETSTWGSDDIDRIGTALLSLTGRDDRLRMFVLLARIQAMATRTGVSFMWQGAWEYDQLSGNGSVKVRKDGRLSGKFKIQGGDGSTFVAERCEAPGEPIQDPPSDRDKWRRRW